MVRRLLAPVLAAGLLVAACGQDAAAPAGTGDVEPLTIGAIPDQDPERLARTYGTVATWLSRTLGIPVRYEPVTDYAASVTLFRTGDLDLVWFGGLTGVQARLQVPGARAIVQRDVDEAFRSVFIVNAATGIRPFTDASGLAALRGRRFTFGSESSTSGRLMPQHFLAQAGVTVDQFAGRPGFSGSHDKTIELVASGSYEAGVLNAQVWEARLAAGEVDPARVVAVYRSPPYHDYHWVLRPDVAARYGSGFVDRLVGAFTGLDPADPEHKAVLDLFGAARFISTSDANYAAIEAVGRQTGLIR